MKKPFNSITKENSKSPSDRRDFIKKASIGGLGMGLLGNNASAEIFAPADTDLSQVQKTTAKANIKITDLKCAVIGGSPVVRITTYAGICGHGQAEYSKSYLKPFVLFYKGYLIGEDPTNVERIMLKIRRMGGFKPWGAAVSAIEMALWDIAGKAAGVPVYKLLGGKVRDQVRAYGPMGRPEGFTITKAGFGFHGGGMSSTNYYGNITKSVSPKDAPHSARGPLTEKGLKSMITSVENMKKRCGDEIGLALDCGPGFMVSDAIRLARALEPFNLMWLEDLITGDYTPYVMADLYREVTQSTTTPIHTGEQMYLRQNFRELIEQTAVRIFGTDPAVVGGIAELKWIAEYADLHGIQIAPHGVLDGLFGLAAHVQVGATMPENYIAFEYPGLNNPAWWFDIVDGIPDPIVKGGLVDVWDRPGLGVDFRVQAARKYLSEEDKTFFD